MFEWDLNDLNLQVDAEIVELETAFRDDYHFEVKRAKMGSDDPGGDVHLAILRTCGGVVRDPSLLIIFYTGRGVETLSNGLTRYDIKRARLETLFHVLSSYPAD